LPGPAGYYGAVLHYDADYELIGKVTGPPCEWVVPRGTAD